MRRTHSARGEAVVGLEDGSLASLPSDFRDETSSDLEQSTRDGRKALREWESVNRGSRVESKRERPTLSLAHNTPTRGETNSGLMDLSISGGMT
jgi:hypothetical protein